MTGTGRYSVAFPRRWWYPACRSRDLGREPRAVELMETPLVLFRDERGEPVALLDRCPHRNYPLSRGRVRGGTLECGYHGWCFDGAGECVGIPGFADGVPTAAPTRRVLGHPAAERDGMVYVWGDPEHPPTADPRPLPTFAGPNAGEVVFTEDLDCTVHASLENALDVPHTAFLHRGLFRGRTTNAITVQRRAIEDGVEAQYLGEPAGMGPIRVGSGSGTTFDHWDRFLMPSTAQIEYRVEGWLRIVNTILHLPMTPFRTRAWFVVRFESRLPVGLVRPIVLARGKQILRQDTEALAHQTERIRSLGGERYTSTDLDVLGTAIWRLLRAAERAEQGGDAPADDGEDATPVERTLTIRV